MNDVQEVLLRLEQAFRVAEDDCFAEAEYIIAAYQDIPDISDLAFRAAIRANAFTYVQQHITEINLNDGFGCSTYLYETADRTMRNYLIASGAFISYDYYSGCRLAIESVGWDIIAFTADFQREVFNKYLAFVHLNTEQLVALFVEQQKCARQQYELQKQNFQITMPDGSKRDLVADARSLGFEVKEGALEFIDLEFEPCPQTKDLLEELGYEFEFEGRQGKQQKIGVYFIK